MTKKEKEELLIKSLNDNGYIEFIESIYDALLELIDIFNVDELVEVYKSLLERYIKKNPAAFFNIVMVEDEIKEINYNNGENTNTRSEGIKTKAEGVLGGTQKRVEHKKTGIKRSNRRDPHIELNYKRRAAVHASHLREHANWKCGASVIEKGIKDSVTEYTNKYNAYFGTNFQVHYAKPKKDWLVWFTRQTMVKQDN